MVKVGECIYIEGSIYKIIRQSEFNNEIIFICKDIQREFNPLIIDEYNDFIMFVGRDERDLYSFAKEYKCNTLLEIKNKYSQDKH